MFNRLHPKARLVVGGIAFAFLIVIFPLAWFIGSADPEEQAPDDVPVTEYDGVEADDPNGATFPVGEAPELPEEEEKVEAGRIAADFIAAFHSLDKDNPTAYFDNSKEYMTARMVANYQGQPKRGSLTTETIEVVETETLPQELEKSAQVWLVGTNAKTTDSAGAETMEFTAYSVLLVKVEDEWKVDGVKINE